MGPVFGVMNAVWTVVLVSSMDKAYYNRGFSVFQALIWILMPVDSRFPAGLEEGWRTCTAFIEMMVKLYNWSRCSNKEQ
jgi:hypothetical protein